MHPAGIRVNITIEDVGILMAAQSKLPKQHPHDTQMCLSHALFLHSLPDGLLFLVPFFFAIISALLTQFLRVVTPGVVKPKIATPATPAVAAGGDAGSTIPDAAIPAADVEAGQVGGEDPPPYAPPPTPVPATSTPAPAEPAKPAVPRSSAQCFVQGTALLILMLFSILCLALSIGWMTHCGKESPWSATAQFFSWLLFFCAPAIWATFGLSCWAMLFRNLFGRAARKKYPFEENMMILGFFIMIGTPFFVIGMIFVKALEAAQRRWCGDALADDEDVEIGELRRVDEVEAELQEFTVGEEEAEASNRHEETAGLIKGMEE